MPNPEDDFFASHPHVDVRVDFNSEVDEQLTALFRDFRDGLCPEVGGVYVVGDWGATPTKVQVLDIAGLLVRLRVLD